MKNTVINGFTLAEMLVLVSVAGILGAALLPSLNTAKETMNAAVCLANMHQWGVAISVYCEDYNDYFPTEGFSANESLDTPYNLHTWFNVLPPYVNQDRLVDLYYAGRPPTPLTRGIWSCPSDTNKPTSLSISNSFFMYGLNNRLDPNGVAQFKRSQCVLPHATFLFCENEGSFSSTNGKYCPARHSGGSNFAFIDGHAEWIQLQDFCRFGNPGCTNVIPEGESGGYGDWSPSVKYHWFPYKGAPT